MKSIKTSTKINLVSVRVLLLLYVLICVLTILFSRSFLNDLLRNAQAMPSLQVLLYFTIPAVLLVFLAIYIFNFIDDILKNKPCSKFQSHLIYNFIIIVVLAATPVFLITIRSVAEITHFWSETELQKALGDAKDMSVELFSLKMEKFEDFLKNTNIDRRIEAGDLFTTRKYPNLASLQDFTINKNGTYKSTNYLGDVHYKLDSPPALSHGFAVRELPRDTDIVRYVDTKNPEIIRVISFFIDKGFDKNTSRIDTEHARFALLNEILLNNKNPFLLFYILVFLFPTILITIIIAINFTRDVSQPIVDLSEATMQVAKGDFTIQILNTPKNELGVLINNFNIMVQNLEKTQNALLRTEKISIWQTMAQQLAHEIKNPLTPIKLTAERVLRRYRSDPEKALDIIENSMLAIVQEVDSLSTLLEEFKTLSRPIGPSSSTTNIREAVEEIITPYLSSYPNIIFDTKSMYTDLSVRIDRKHLAQIISNLVINAIDAMNGNGNIVMRTDIVNKRQSRFCRLSIEDTGKGIDKESIDKVWTPYFTTKESGTGLGLPIVERIITDHGGGIWFNSAQGEGTTFFVDLPVGGLISDKI
ncbi:MAG: hypothetical protein Ta2F_04800 [Termitinemataceae bacterium]|nr:MAG: hypothetical protein Ta2F_04800 [Termitinemataceae bacterium]